MKASCSGVRLILRAGTRVAPRTVAIVATLAKFANRRSPGGRCRLLRLMRLAVEIGQRPAPHDPVARDQRVGRDVAGGADPRIDRAEVAVAVVQKGLEAVD